jgi:hypothetical protein
MSDAFVGLPVIIRKCMVKTAKTSNKNFHFAPLKENKL